MSEIVTRLLLNTKDFDANLSKSKRGVKDYEGGITSFAKTAGAGIAKFAAGLGVAMGAGEAFNRVLHSSQTLGDMTAANMSAAKRSIDEFFYSIGSGDFTGFLSGLENIISKAKDAYAAIDQLGNTRISHGYFSSKYNAGIAESRTLAQNKQAPTNERITAFNEWKKGINKQVGINSTLQSDLTTAITKAIESEIGLKNFSVNFNDFERALEIDVTNPLKRSDLKQQYSDSYKEYVKGINWIESKRKTSISQAPARSFEINKKYDNEIESLTQQHREAIIVNAMLNKYKDEELQELANQATQYQNLDTSISSLIKEFNVAAVKFNKTNKADKDFKNVESFEGYKVYVDNRTKGGSFQDKKETPVTGSIGELDAKLTEWRDKYNKAATEEARTAALNMIEAITNQKATIEFQAKINISDADINKMLPQSIKNDFITQANTHNTNKKNNDTFKQTDAYKSAIKSMNKLQNKPLFDKKDIDVNNDYAESLYGIGYVMQSLSGITGESGAAWLNWGANVVSTISQAIPAIRDFVKAQQAQAAGEAIVGAAGSGPWGWLSAGIAVASIIASFASIPKFANGGVVYGNSLVNVGEYAGANSNPEIIAPLSKLKQYIQPQEETKTLGGEVVFRINGTELKGVLNNFDRKHKKFS